MTELCDLGAVEAVALLRSKRVSPLEMVEAAARRIEAVDGQVNALPIRFLDVAREEAKRFRADGPGSDAPGWLAGLPIAVKDYNDVGGQLTTNGSPIYAGNVAAADDVTVATMRARGAIPLAKSNVPEFAGSNTFNPVWGATKNPWNLEMTAGGSSGGAAAALASRMVPLADGSDYGGSLRNPAGWNNVFGFRTSFGVVPAAGPEVWLAGMGVQGPMACSVEDLALLLSVQAGYDPRSPLSLPGDGTKYRQNLDAPVKGRRIGWLGDFGGDVPHEPEVLEVCRTALKSFEALGCTVEEAKIEAPVEPAWQTIIKLRAWQQSGQIIANYRNPAERALLKPEAVWEVETALPLSAFDITAASEARTTWSMAVKKLFDRFDYLVLPSSQIFPFPVDDRWPKTVAGHQMRTYHEWMKSALLITLSGNPALVAPAGFGAAGLPIGLQIVGPNHGEVACLQLAKAYEVATGWTNKRPPGGI